MIFIDYVDSLRWRHVPLRLQYFIDMYEMWWREDKSVKSECEEREVWKWRSWSVKVKCESQERELWIWRAWSVKVKCVKSELKSVKCESEERNVW